MTTRTANDPLRQAEKIRQSIVARAKHGPQIVFVGRGDKAIPVTPGSPQHEYLQRWPDYVKRVAGTFDSSASAALIAAAIREVKN